MTDNDSTDKKVTLDKSELSTDRAKEKVELDLDDAPFLDEEDDELPEEELAAESLEKAEKPRISPDIEEKPAIQFWKNRIIVVGLISLSLILLLLSLWFFLFRDKAIEHEYPVEDARVAEKEPVFEELVNFEPFMVELRDEQHIQFLFTRFSFPAQSEELAREIRDKTIILRDAIYYYLRNQEPVFLRNEENSDRIKNDTLSVVNQYLSTGSVKDLLIEEYLVK